MIWTACTAIALPATIYTDTWTFNKEKKWVSSLYGFLKIPKFTALYRNYLQIKEENLYIFVLSASQLQGDNTTKAFFSIEPDNNSLSSAQHNTKTDNQLLNLGLGSEVENFPFHWKLFWLITAFQIKVSYVSDQWHTLHYFFKRLFSIGQNWICHLAWLQSWRKNYEATICSKSAIKLCHLPFIIFNIFNIKLLRRGFNFQCHQCVTHTHRFVNTIYEWWNWWILQNAFIHLHPHWLNMG